jgi:hypothetical protein
MVDAGHEGTPSGPSLVQTLELAKLSRCFNAHPVLTLPVWVDSYLFIRTLQ